MNIEMFPSGPFATNAYIVFCEKTKQAAIIDPGVDSSDRIISYLEKNTLSPVKILLTHSHWDHIADVAKLKKQYQIPVFIHALDKENLSNPGQDKLPMMMTIEAVEPDHLIDEGDLIDIGTYKFKVLHTPGHSPGSVCFYCEDLKMLISGDTLFKQSIGNISFPTSEPDKMWDSLKKLEELPKDTEVYPGHGPQTTIADEAWLPQAKKVFGY